MNSETSSYLFLCMVCGVPYVMGFFSSLILLRRFANLGFPWFLFPFGGWFKRLYEERQQ